MIEYHQLLRRVLKGRRRPNRTGIDTVSVFGEVIDLSLDPFPLVTTKKMYWQGIVAELIWFLRGEDNIKWLQQYTSIWDAWADNGHVGPIYGVQWRDWGGIDQVERVIEGLQSSPYGRRHIISAWNVSDLADMALPPCHMMVQFYVDGAELHAQMYQRSADLFLGVPFNIASYALLTYMIAQQTGLRPGRLRICFGDAHIYVNHLSQVNIQLQRECLPLPRVALVKRDSINDYTVEDCRLIGYQSHGRLKGEVAV